MRWLICVLLLALAAGCTKSDEVRAKEKARQAGQELKQDLKQAGRELEKGAEKARREIKEATSDSDRKRR